MSPETVASMARTHPCLRGNPPPASAQQPRLTVETRFFHLESQTSSADYPYDLTPSRGKLAHVVGYNIPYYYISGLGAPPADLTGSDVGDIYVDITKGREAAYGRVASGAWKRWYDQQPCLQSPETTVQHPHFRKRMLWCSDARGISWFVKTTVTSNQERAKLRGAVAQDAHKSAEVRWREASGLIAASLAEEQRAVASASASASLAPKGGADTSRTRRFTSTLSPPLEPREASPVLGKRSRKSALDQHSDAALEAKRCKAALEMACQRLKEENAELETQNSALETELARRSEEENSAARQHFAQWAEKFIVKGVKNEDLVIKNELGASCREYLDFQAELTAVEELLALEESRYADVKNALGRTIAEDEQCVKQFELARSHLAKRTVRL
ncbi:hypothetical protein DFH09DRAFT_1147182 [Mycena vulgaris]|nr:hypothetical protein DFH09DRAFT_1147182 [Mycena vulgaris]